MPDVSHRHWHRSRVGSREFAFALIRILVRDEHALFEEARAATAETWPVRVSQPLGATATQSAAERAESATTEVDVQGVAVQSQMADGERRRMERMGLQEQERRSEQGTRSLGQMSYLLPLLGPVAPALQGRVLLGFRTLLRLPSPVARTRQGLVLRGLVN